MRARKDEKPLRMIVLISQLGICMLTAIFSCVLIGYFVSRWTGILWLFPLFLVIGAMAGFKSCYNIIRRFVDLKARPAEDPDIIKMKDRMDGTQR